MVGGGNFDPVGRASDGDQFPAPTRIVYRATMPEPVRLSLCLVLLLTACGPTDEDPGADGIAGDGGGDGISASLGIAMCAGPAPEMSWPAPAPEPPACTPLFDTFALPAMAAAKGAIKLRPSARLQPLGIAGLVSVTVRQAEGGEVDPTFDGELEVTVGPGVTLLSQTPVSKGLASLRVRVDTPGAHELGVALKGDPRVGSVGLWGYKTRLPVIEMHIEPADLEDMLAHKNDNIYKPVALALDGVAASGKVRLHGGSSRGYVKKSWRVKLAEGDLLADGRDTMILRAEWSDRTLLRNWLAVQVIEALSTAPLVSSARFVHLRLNDGFSGVMLDVERIDDEFLVARGLNPSASLYEPDPPFALSVPGGNLTPLPDMATYRQVYDHHEGNIDYADLVALIEVAVAWSKADFAARIGQVVRLEEILRYLAAMVVIQNQDHIKKNYYLYRDTKSLDCTWRIIAWDLDLSFGRLWTPEKDILDDQMFVNGDLFVGEDKGHSFYNGLFDQMFAVPALRQRYLELVTHLLDHVFTEKFIAARVAWATCELQPDLLADPLKRSSNESYMGRVDELNQFVSGRRSWLKVAVAGAK